MVADQNRVLIAGAGIGGLATAVALARAGRPVTVLERSSEPGREAGTAFNLWGNAVTALERLGLGARVRESGEPIEIIRLFDHRGRVLGDTPIAEIGARLGTTSVNVRRSVLQRLLHTAADEAGVEIFTGAPCTGFRLSDDGGVVATGPSGEHVGGVLVGADGARSAVRAQLVGDGEPRESSHPVRGIAPGTAVGVLPHTVAMIWGPRGGGAGYWPLADGTVSWTVGATSTLRRDVAAAPDPEARKRAVLGFVAQFPAPFAALVEATPAEQVVTSPVLVRDEAAQWGGGPVTLLGDAAHAMPTVFAQGACQALEDAVVLGEELLAHGGDAVAGLRAYEARRRPRMDWLRKRVFTLDKLQSVENRFLCMVRNASTRTAPKGRSAQSWEQMMTFDLAPAG